MELTDCHCHLSSLALDNGAGALSGVFQRCAQQGVSRVVVSLLHGPSDCAAELEAIEAAAQAGPVRVAFTLGTEPASTGQRVAAIESDMARATEAARRLADQAKIVAIGEVGLDHYWPLVAFLKAKGLTEREAVEEEISRNRDALIAEPLVCEWFDAQAEAFRQWLDLAVQMDLPVVVHERDAHDDVMAVIADSGIAGQRVMLHCFSGTCAQAQAAARRGHYVSLPASLVYREPYRDVAKAVDLEHTLIETDSPYQSPIPGLWKRAFAAASKRAEAEGISRKARDRWIKDAKLLLFSAGLEHYLPGLAFGAAGSEVPALEHFATSRHRSQNEPAFVRCAAVGLAEAQGLDPATVARVTTENACRLMGSGRF